MIRDRGSVLVSTAGGSTKQSNAAHWRASLLTINGQIPIISSEGHVFGSQITAVSATSSDVRNSVFMYLVIDSRDASNGMDLLRHL